MNRALTLLLVLLTVAGSALAGLPPTTSKLSSDGSDVTTFKYRFPNFSGTHTGSTVSLDILSVLGGGTGASTTAAGPFVLRSGDTMTGDLTVTAAILPGGNVQTQINTKQPTLSSLITVTSQYVMGFTAPNTFVHSQPSFTDLLGTATIAQGGTGVTTAATAPWVEVAGDTMTGALKGATGSSALPQLTGPDTGTGLSFPLTNKMTVSTAGTARMSFQPGGSITMHPNTGTGDYSFYASDNQLILGMGTAPAFSAGVFISDNRGPRTAFGSNATNANPAYPLEFSFSNTGTDPSVLVPDDTTTAPAFASFKNHSATAGNFSALTFAGTGVNSTAVSSGIVGVNDVHTAAAQTGHLEFWTRLAGGTFTRRGYMDATGFGYGVGAPTQSLDISATARFRSLTTPGILVNSSTGVISATQPTNGQLLIGSTGAAPVAATITAGAGITVTPGAGSITIAASGTPAANLVTKTANYTSVNTNNVIICNAATGSFTITLETAVGNTGVVHQIKKSDTSGNSVTVDANGSQTLDGDLTAVLTDPYTSITIFSDGSNWHVF